MKQPTSLVAQHPQVEGSDDEIVIWDDDFDNDDFSSFSRPHRLYPVASLLTNPQVEEPGSLHLASSPTCTRANVVSCVIQRHHPHVCIGHCSCDAHSSAHTTPTLPPSRAAQAGKLGFKKRHTR